MKITPNNRVYDSADPYLKALGERIGTLVNMLGGKRALALRLGVHESMLYRYIKGENALSAPLLVALAAVANVSLEWLATGAGVAQPKPDMLRETGVAAYRSAPAANAVLAPVPGCGKSATATLAFDADWLQQLCGARNDQVCLFEMQGESMEPTLRSGDQVLIDRRVKKVDQDGLYAVQLSAGLEIKRVQKRPAGAMKLSSDNPNCQSVTLSRAAAVKQLRLLGRVVWFGRRL